MDYKTLSVQIVCWNSNVAPIKPNGTQLSLQAVQEFSDRKEARFRDLATLLVPVPGLLNMIARANAHGCKQAVVTNAPRVNAEYMLKVLHLPWQV